jgi:hypothetical protein
MNTFPFLPPSFFPFFPFFPARAGCTTSITSTQTAWSKELSSKSIAISRQYQTPIKQCLGLTFYTRANCRAERLYHLIKSSPNSISCKFYSVVFSRTCNMYCICTNVKYFSTLVISKILKHENTCKKYA